jgi:hypothetical protein
MHVVGKNSLLQIHTKFYSACKTDISTLSRKNYAFFKVLLNLYIIFHQNVWSMSLMKEQFVVTHGYTILQETEDTWQIINRPTFKHVMFPWKYMVKQFFVNTIFW